MSISVEQRRQLDELGYTLLPGLIAPAEVTALISRLEELWTAEGEAAGSENYKENNVRRLANLANKGDIFRPVFTHPQVLELARQVMGPDVRLSMLNARDVPPLSEPGMPFHCDTDGGVKPDEHGYKAFTAVWMLDDFTHENGATRVVPGSHRSDKSPKEAMPDLYHHPDEVQVEGQAGDVLVFNGHCWHTGGENLSNRHRRAILVHYLRGDQPMGPNRRQHLSPETAAQMTNLERELLGL